MLDRLFYLRRQMGRKRTECCEWPYEVDLNFDDEIVPSTSRVRANQLDARMEQYIPGDRVSILVARRDRLMRLDGRLGAEPLRAWVLEVDPGASTAQRRLLDLWLTKSGNQADTD